MKTHKWPAHLQLNYLLKKYSLNKDKLVQEIQQYYSGPDWQILLSRGNKKVRQVKLKPGHTAPKPSAPQTKLSEPQKKKPEKTGNKPVFHEHKPRTLTIPQVSYKKKRTLL